MAEKTLSALVQSFFTVALPQRGMSPLTILSYRDALKLLVRFVSARAHRSVVRLEWQDIDVAAVREFLHYLESDRRNGIGTRNNRLAAIRSFFAFAAGEEPMLAEQCKRICTLPMKRAPIKPIPYLEQDEMQALLSAPDETTALGRRDYTVLLFLYNTGARVQELADVRALDLQLVRPPQALLRGKGRKERICPLWATTVRAVRRLLEETRAGSASTDKIFRNAQGEPLTRFGVDYILKKHVATAAHKIPSLERKRISPHVIRHTSAVHMLNSGVDVNVIRAWLGHVDLRTTNIYAEINLTTKRKALEACAPGSCRGKRPSWKRDDDLLAWLEQL